MFNRLFKLVITDKFVVLYVFYIRFRFRFNAKKYRNRKVIATQDKYDMQTIKQARKIILLTAELNGISGGIMSFFSILETSRKLKPDFFCAFSTVPNTVFIYSHYLEYPNKEKIYRFDQFVENAKSCKELILHIPEYYAKVFYSSLKESDLAFFANIEKLHINLLNQNIELMPEPKEFVDLYTLTKNITMTTAFSRYTTQEICDKYNLPTHLFSVNIDISRFKSFPFDKKRKIIVYSYDSNPYKERILTKLKQKLFGWDFVCVQEMKFTEYMDLISRAFFTISFGEGFDGYFTQPQYVGSIGFAVYNDTFFPNRKWLGLENVYADYVEMEEKLCNDILCFSLDKAKFDRVIADFMRLHKGLYQVNEYEDNLRRFYKGQYDFVPKQS